MIKFENDDHAKMNIIEPLVYVIVPVFNRVDLTLRFLESFSRIKYKNYKIYIIDGGSTDGTPQVIRKSFPNVTLLHDYNDLWWTEATNIGVVCALNDKADYVLTINNDSIVESNLLEELVNSALCNPRSIVGSKILEMKNKNTIWGLGSYMNWGHMTLFKLHYSGKENSDIESLKNPIECEMVCGNGTLIPVDCFRKVGLYDEKNFPQYHADSEFCLRARKNGYKVIVNFSAIVYNDTDHVGSAKITSIYDNFFSKKTSTGIKQYYAITKYYEGMKVILFLKYFILFLLRFVELLARKYLISPKKKIWPKKMFRILG